MTPFLKWSRELKTFTERLQWANALVGWTSWDRRPPKEYDDPTLSSQAARLAYFFHTLEKQQEDRKAVSIQMWNLLNEGSSYAVFTEVGLVRERGFFSELAARAWQKVFPIAAKDDDLLQLFKRNFKSAHSAQWILDLPDALMDSAVRVVLEGGIGQEKSIPKVREGASDALLLLGAHIASVGLSRHVLLRSPEEKPSQSGFLYLSRTLQEAAESLKANQKALEEPLLQKIRDAAGKSEAALVYIKEKIETAGVSVQLVYDIECLQCWIDRSLSIVQLFAEPLPRGSLIRAFLFDIARETSEKYSIQQLLRQNIHLISRKIVERTGMSGEHYISKGTHDYFKMLYQAMGGGILTAFTTIGKYYATIQQFPLFFDGFFVGLNYAVSFVVIQLLHFTLATKQPSMTAPNLAGKLLQFEENADVNPFVEEVARIARSQWISIVGNVSAVVPMAFFLDQLWLLKYGHSVFTLEYAEHTLHSLDPVNSLTIPYAMGTGIILWISSLLAGAFENWVVYENIPNAIANSRRLQRVVGKTVATKISHWFLKNAAGFGGNISLGFLLGYVGVFGKFFGMHLEVRHVTLSAGTLALATNTLIRQEHFQWQMLLYPCLGICVIGLMNVSTSFFLALYIAARARKVKTGHLRFLLRRIVTAFFRDPRPFFYPPKGS